MMKPMKQTKTATRSLELLAPAGDMERLHMAVLYGADAVYLAGTSFGMRSFAGNFTGEELPKAVDFAHKHGVRVHVTVNTMPCPGGTRFPVCRLTWRNWTKQESTL